MMNSTNNLLTLVPSVNETAIAKFEKPAARMKRNTKRVGIVSELVAMQRFAAAGLRLLLPLGENSPYDIVLEDKYGRLIKIQVKTGRLRRGVVFFNCYSSHAHRGARPEFYFGKIDFFAVYCPDNEEFYIVPIGSKAVTRGSASLRVLAPANNMSKTINWAREYRFDESNPDALFVGVAHSGAAGED